MALLLVAGWSFAEAILFVIVADLPISWIAVRHGWRRASLAALIASVAASAGGAVTYVLAAANPERMRELTAALPGIDFAMIDAAAGDLVSGGSAAMLVGALSGVPYKLYALAAGAQDWGLLAFTAASPFVRLPRFMLAALLPALIASSLSPWLGLRARLRLLAAFWLLFYAFYFAVMPR